MKRRYALLYPSVNTIGLVGWWKLYEGTTFDYSLNGNKGELKSAALVAHYKMNDDAPDTVVVDSTGGSNGTLNGGDNTEDINIDGKILGALNLNGNDDYIDTGSAFQTTFRGSFSISLWFKADDGQPTSTECLLGTRQASPEDVVRLLINPDGTIEFTYVSNVNVAKAETVAAVLSNGQETWHNIIVVADSTINAVGGLKLYFDGAVQTLDATDDGDTTDVVFADYVNALNLFIGARNNNTTADLFYAGDIDNVILYSKALSALEVNTLYKQGKGTEAAVFALSAYPGFSFNGSDDFIAVASNPMSPSGDWSLLGWVKSSGEVVGDTDEFGTVFGSATFVTNVQGVIVRMNSTTKNLIAFLGDGTISNVIDLVTDISTINKDIWFHIVLTFVSATNTVVGYVNGSIIGTSVGIDFADSGKNFGIGRSSDLNVAQSFWFGLIDDVMIFNIAKSAAEVKSIYETTRGRYGV